MQNNEIFATYAITIYRYFFKRSLGVKEFGSLDITLFIFCFNRRGASRKATILTWQKHTYSYNHDDALMSTNLPIFEYCGNKIDTVTLHR